jgi:hypothetical protein
MANTTTMKKVILIAEPQVTIINTPSHTVAKKDMTIPMSIITNTVTPIIMPTVMTMIMAATIPMQLRMNMIIPTNTLIPTPINTNMLTVMKVRDIPTGTNIPIPTVTVTDIAVITAKMEPAVVTVAMSKTKISKF